MCNLYLQAALFCRNSRYVVVGDKDWLNWLTNLGQMSNIVIKHLDLEN